MIRYFLRVVTPKQGGIGRAEEVRECTCDGPDWSVGGHCYSCGGYVAKPNEKPYRESDGRSGG